MSERRSVRDARAQEELRCALAGEDPRQAGAGAGVGAVGAAGAGVGAAGAAGAGAAGAAGAGAAGAGSAGSAAGAASAVRRRTEAIAAQKKRRRKRLIVAAACAVALVAAGAFALTRPQDAGSQVFEGFFDEDARAGQAPNKTPAELQADLNRVVEEGMFNISIASVIEFASPAAPGKAFIENVPGNPYDMQVELALKDTGEVLYESKGVAPGNYIESISLARELEPGPHDAVATFTALDRETHAEKGRAAAEVTLLVGEGG